MKKSIILSAVALASLGLAACGGKAADDASNAEIELNETMAPVVNETLDAAPAENAAAPVNQTADVAADAADAAKDAAAAAAEAAANHM